MRRTTFVLLLAIAFGAIATAWRTGGIGGPQPPSTSERIERLRQRVAEMRVQSGHTVAKYRPTIKASIDELNAPVAALLRQLPSVVQVEVSTAAGKPNCRIIHLRDWHYVPKELYALDLRETDHNLTDDELDLLYDEFLLQVELVQFEQMEMLRCLIQQHGLKQVLCEGYSADEVDVYRAKVTALRTIERDQVPQLRQQLEEVRGLHDDLSEESKATARTIESELVEQLADHRRRLLQIGAAGRLLLAGELDDVLPLEDAAAFKRANPITAAGKVHVEMATIKARHDAQVSAAQAAGPVAVVVLGAAHDLTESSRRSGDCEYVRITTRAVGELVD